MIHTSFKMWSHAAWLIVLEPTSPNFPHVRLRLSVELGSKVWENFRLSHGSNQVLIKWVGKVAR